MIADRIPPEILGSARGVLWNRELRGGKETKVPYSPHRPMERAAVDDPSTWGPVAEALAAVEDGKADGAGFVLGDGLVGIDLDGCRDPETGTIEPWALEIVRTIDSYTETSPSQRGLHILAQGELPPGRRRKGPVEMYSDGRYFTLTGDHVRGTPAGLRDRTVELAALHGRIFAEPNGRGPQTTPEPAAPLDLDDSELIERASRASNGPRFRALWAGDCSAYPSQSEADQALANILAFWTGADAERMDRLFRLSGLYRPKWDSRRGETTYGAQTIATALANCRETYSPGSRRNGNGTRLHPPPTSTSEGARLTDFWGLMTEARYIFEPTGDLWPASSVNSRLSGGDVAKAKEKPTTWLNKHRAVEQQTWAPGQPKLIEGRLISHGGWMDRLGCRVFNLYCGPQIKLGNPDKAGPWLEHWQKMYGDDAAHAIRWFAHRVQRPAEKLNHAIVLGGAQGIGKDTGLEPVKHAVGPWNCAEIAPTHLLGRFNPFVKSVMLRISEARDLGDIDRYSFYEHLKVYTAAPPDVLRVDEKNVREYVVPNVVGVVITTNHKTDGLYLPADDRRHFVAWSDCTKDDFSERYWRELWSWYESGGYGHVAAYLTALDLSDFNPKAPPPKTAAFWDVVDANRAPEDSELADSLDRLGNPEATTLGDIAARAESGFGEWLRDRRNARQVPHRMESVGYVPVRNDCATDGKWKVGGRRQVIYARRELTTRDRLAAARLLVEAGR